VKRNIHNAEALKVLTGRTMKPVSSPKGNRTSWESAMLTRIRRSMEDKDQGFTLIELLVVIIIIGILAAIAIPVFLNQRKKAVDASMKADLKNAATVVESYYTNTQLYPASQSFAAGTNPVGSENVILSPNNAIGYTNAYNGTGTYCMIAVNTNGTQNWVYESDKGGLQSPAKTSCS